MNEQILSIQIECQRVKLHESSNAYILQFEQVNSVVLYVHIPEF